MTPWSTASLALASVLLAACGAATSRTVSASPTPSPSSPETSSPVRPLEHFPLTRGYPETNGDDGSPVEVSGRSGLEKLVLCHEGWTPRAPIAPVDLIGATYTGEAEDSRGITLARYDDAAAAEDVLEYVRVIVTSCPVDGDGEYSSVYDGTDRAVGDEGFLVTRRFRGPQGGFDTGLVVYDFARVGDLLLVNWHYGEGGGSDVTIKWSQRAVTDQSDDLLPDLCEYAVPACSVREPPSPALQVGPDGIGGVTLGMSGAAAAHLGLLIEPRHDGSGCSVGYRADGTAVITADIRPGVGVVTVYAAGMPLVTPEGVGTGMTSWDVYTRYPDAENDGAPVTKVVAPVPGRPEAAYWFLLDRDEFITDVILMLSDERCYS